MYYHEPRLHLVHVLIKVRGAVPLLQHKVTVCWYRPDRVSSSRERSPRSSVEETRKAHRSRHVRGAMSAAMRAAASPARALRSERIARSRRRTTTRRARAVAHPGAPSDADPSSSSSASASAPSSSSPSLDAILSNVRRAMGVSPTRRRAGMVWGEGVNLGMPVRWCMRHDGASFAEEAVGPQLSYASGHAEGEREVWETDFSGYTQTLQLDDHEAALLAGWTRTGWWVTADASRALELELVEEEEEEEEDVSDEDSAAGVVTVSLRLRDGGVIAARVAIDTTTWLPVGMKLNVCGDEEAWTFEGWHDALDGPSSSSSGSSERRGGMLYPRTTTLRGAAGGTQTFTQTGARANAGVKPSWFQVRRRRRPFPVRSRSRVVPGGPTDFSLHPVRSFRSVASNRTSHVPRSRPTAETDRREPRLGPVQRELTPRRADRVRAIVARTRAPDDRRPRRRPVHLGHGRQRPRDLVEARSIHWSPYDRVRAVNAVP